MTRLLRYYSYLFPHNASVFYRTINLSQSGKKNCNKPWVLSVTINSTVQLLTYFTSWCYIDRQMHRVTTERVWDGIRWDGTTCRVWRHLNTQGRYCDKSTEMLSKCDNKPSSDTGQVSWNECMQHSLMNTIGLRDLTYKLAVEHRLIATQVSHKNNSN